MTAPIVYPYVDEAGAALYETVRKPPKKFFQRVPQADGTYVNALNGVRRVPYRLPELLRGIAQNRTIFVAEGEKDADSLEARGFTATTNAGGTGWPWTTEFAEYFRGAPRVIVLADCDKPGRDAAGDRAALLCSVVDDVRIVNLAPERHDGYDISDWFADGHTADELRARVRSAPKIAPTEPANAREHSNGKPESNEHHSDAGSAGAEQTKSNGKPPKRLNLRDLRDIKFERVTWFETNMIPRAELSLVNGDGGIGKTTSILDLVGRSSAGRPMPSGLQHDRPMKWLIVAEEDRHGLLRARLDVAGANHDNIRLVESVGEERDFLTFPSHVKSLHDTVLEGEWDGVLIDALLNHLDDDVNASKPQEMRRALRPITEIAHATGATIAAIRHLSKGVGPASQRGLGSSEARNLCRSELTVGPHPDEDAHPGLFMIALSKANLSSDRKATMAYRLASSDVIDDDGLPTTIARVHWEAAPPTISADDLLDRQEPADRGKVDAAADWLRAELSNGERRAKELCDDAVKAGHARPTVYRAKSRLGVCSVQQGFPAQSYWCLKEPGVSQVSQVSQYSMHEKTETADAGDTGFSVNSQHETVRHLRHHETPGFFETPGPAPLESADDSGDDAAAGDSVRL